MNIIVNNCDYKEIEMEILMNLPVEVAHNVFMHLPTNDVLTFWNSNSKLRALMNYNYFWKMKCKSEQYQELQDPIRYKTFEKYLKRCLLYWQVSNYLNH